MADICILTKTWRYSIAWIVHSLAKALTESGLSVSLAAPLSEPEVREFRSPRLKRIIIPRERVGDGSVLARTTASMQRILAGFGAALEERRHTRNFLITIPDPLIFSLPLFAILRLSGARILFMVHDAVPHAWRLPRVLQGLERRAHGLSYNLATELIILTPALRQPLEKIFAIAPEKITVIPHGPLGLGELPPPPGAGRLFLFGSLRSNKSVLEVIEGVIIARKTDRGITLVIAGEPHPSERAYWQRCRAAMARDPDGFDIREGFLADEALPDLVAEIDAFVMAYQRFDSQSGVAVLAALSSRPVLCTLSGGLRDLVDQGMCHQLIEQPVSGDGVARAILAYCARPATEWRDEAAASTRLFAATMSWPAIAARFADRIRT